MTLLPFSSSRRPDPPGIPLASLRPGQSGKIAWLDPHQAFAGRLRDLGFVPGTWVQVRRNAPLKDPVEYELRNTRVCLRKSEACTIYVDPLSLQEGV